MKTYFRILSFARPLGFKIPQYAVFILFHVVFSVLNFTILKPLLDVLFDETANSPVITEFPEFEFDTKYLTDIFYYYFGGVIREYGRLQALYFTCGVIVTSVFFSNLFQYLASIVLASVRVKVVTRMRNFVFNNVTGFDLGYFTENKKGDIMSRITTDMQQVESTVVNSLKALFKEPLLMIGYFIALFNMSVDLTLYTLLILPVSGGIISYIAKKLKKRATRMQESIGRINGIVDETLTGMRIIKAFTARKYTNRKFEEEVDRYGHHSFNMSVRQDLARPISEFLGVAFVSLILLIGGTMVLNNESELSASGFITFIIIFSQVLTPAKALSNAFSNVYRGIASGERIFELADVRPAIEESPVARSISQFGDRISFRDVSFAYNIRKVIENISFEIEKGKIIALVGPSGGGKSTIADLIPRFYDPVEGHIELDGVDLRDYKLDDLRGQMGIVTQESILFNDTIFQNIAYGKKGATMDEVTSAARIANAHDFIEKLDNGYHTFIGERGSKLSGGQRQRISIARAVLKNPPILILDEATSALDSESEKLVQEAIYQLMQNRTTLVIAHRLSTVQNADEIIVLQDGQILQKGTHDQLMQYGGLYNKLIEMQSV